MLKQIESIWKHPWTVAACNFLLIMAIYTLLRLFFYWVNQPMFPDVTAAHLVEMCVGGLQFDLTALLYLNSVYLLLMLLPLPWRANATYLKVANWFYWVPNIIGIIVNCMDTVYVQFTDRRTTCIIFKEFENDTNLGNIIAQSVVQYWYVTVVCIALSALLIWLTRRKVITTDNPRSILYYLRELVIMCVSAYFIVIGIRGGFGVSTRPITISNSLKYTNRPTETAIVLNTPFSLMKSLENTTYQEVHHYSEEELEQIFTPIHPADSTRQFRADNVVVILLESFSKEFVGFFNQHLDNGTYMGYTPFLDSLLQYSRTYSLSFASGRLSIDAMPSTLSSIPMLIEPYIVTPYSTNLVSSLADCLGRKGYTTAFYHGAPNGSMGFQAFAKAIGFANYYGKDEYDGPDALDGTWGVWDEEFLQYFVRGISAMPEPFFATVFTLSSHHPFNVPDRYEDVLPQGTHPMHRCIAYTDNALRKFFEEAKQQPWYDNTLFVISADHTSSLTKAEYLNDKGLFEVPILFFAPDNSLAGISDMPISQPDVMPSVLNYLGYDETYFAFGKDVLTSEAVTENKYAVNYNSSVYQVFSTHLLLQFDGAKSIALFDFVEDPQLQHNRIAELDSIPEAQDMERYLKAYQQQYINRIIHDQLTVH